MLIPRSELPISPAAPTSVTATRVAETQALVERLVTSMRVGRSSRGAEVHMQLEGPASEVRVREVDGRLEVELHGARGGTGLADRIERALTERGLRADVTYVSS